jgi:hypothetical protein
MKFGNLAFEKHPTTSAYGIAAWKEIILREIERRDETLKSTKHRPRREERRGRREGEPGGDLLSHT